MAIYLPAHSSEVAKGKTDYDLEASSDEKCCCTSPPDIPIFSLFCSSYIGYQYAVFHNYMWYACIQAYWSFWIFHHWHSPESGCPWFKAVLLAANEIATNLVEGAQWDKGSGGLMACSCIQLVFQIQCKQAILWYMELFSSVAIFFQVESAGWLMVHLWYWKVIVQLWIRSDLIPTPTWSAPQVWKRLLRWALFLRFAMAVEYPLLRS